MLIGILQLCCIAATSIDDIEQSSHQQAQQANDDRGIEYLAQMTDKDFYEIMMKLEREIIKIDWEKL